MAESISKAGGGFPINISQPRVSADQKFVNGEFEFSDNAKRRRRKWGQTTFEKWKGSWADFLSLLSLF
jgi:hypothetical protein